MLGIFIDSPRELPEDLDQVIKDRNEKIVMV